MLQYIVKRILVLIPVLIVMSIVCFIIIQLPPGDFLTTHLDKLRASGVKLNEETIRAMEVRYGVDKPMPMQYLMWVGNILRGNLGYSFTWNQDVNSLIGQRLVATLAISLSSVVLIWLLAFPMGFLAATHQNSKMDYTFTAISIFGMSIPEFLLALVAIWLYFAATGQYAGGINSDYFVGQPMSWAKFIDMIQHMWLPFAIIAFTGTAGLFKTFKANLLDELQKPYVKTAIAKGVPRTKLLIKYPVRIAMIPFISTVGWMLPGLISGQTILAIVLNLPTLAPLLNSSLRNQDMYLAGSIVLIMGALTVVGTVISDILLAVTDPRIRSTL